MKSIEEIAEAATLPFRIVESMRLPCGYERSFKLLPGVILANRYLLGIETRRAPAKALVEACRRMEMPREQLRMFVEQLPHANLVFLGFEADDTGGAIYKIYLEFWDHVRKRYREDPDTSGPLLSHRGFKWDHADPSRQVVTDYRWIPGLHTGEILSRIKELYDDLPGAIGAVAVRDIVSAADGQAGNRRYIYVEVSEAGNDRRSFDLNLYPAGLRVRDIRPAVESVAERLDAPADPFARLMSIVPDKLFGHVSGGIGRDGSEYFTVYYEN